MNIYSVGIVIAQLEPSLCILSAKLTTVWCAFTPWISHCWRVDTTHQGTRIQRMLTRFVRGSNRLDDVAGENYFARYSNAQRWFYFPRPWRDWSSLCCMHISQSLQQRSPCVIFLFLFFPGGLHLISFLEIGHAIPSYPGQRMEKDEVMLLKCWDSRGNATNGATICGETITIRKPLKHCKVWTQFRWMKAVFFEHFLADPQRFCCYRSALHNSTKKYVDNYCT